MLNRIIYKNFKSNIRNYLFFFLSNTLAVSLLLVFGGLRYNLAASIKDEASAYVMKMDFMVAAIMLSVVAVFLTVYAVLNYVKLRIRDYSMLTVLGIRKKTFKKIIFAEYGLGWLFSVIAGLVCGNIIYYIYQEMLYKIEPSFLVKSVIGYKAYRNTLVISFVIIVVVVMATMTMMEGKNLSTFASGKEAKELKPKNFRWLILVLAGLVLWVIGNVKFPVGDGGPILAQVLWLIGSFFVLCIGGSMLLEWMKKRKRFYFRNLLRLNQLYHHFSTNYLVIFMLFVMHFVALGYLATGIAGSLPIRVDRDKYPYNFVWSAREEDKDFMEEISKKYEGTVKEVPIVKVVSFTGLDNFGISADTYEELTGEECTLKDDEIMVVMEMGEDGGEVTNERTRLVYDIIHLGKFRGEYVSEYDYPGYGYQKANIKKMIIGNIIGQMVDGYRDNCVILSNSVFEETREKILEDPEEASVLALFQIPEEYREQAGKELKKYVKDNGVESLGELQSTLYDTDKIIEGVEGRNLFQTSSKLFITIALLFSSIFILKMKTMSEEGMTVRRYSFLNCMGMRGKKRIANLRFEVRCISFIPLVCGLFLGVDYVISNWNTYRTMGEELPGGFFKMWAATIGVYLAIQFIGMEWTARTASKRVEKKLEEIQ